MNLKNNYSKNSYEYIGDTMKKLLLLGGSAQQVIAIEEAKKCGYYTVLCDYLTDNPGQYIADKFYLVSTTDMDAVLKVAMDEKVDGVIAYASDPAAPTAAYVCEKMGLSTNPYEAVSILCNKDKFREFLGTHGFNAPVSYRFAEGELYGDVTDNMELPVIVKPVDSSGSKGITVLEDWNNLDQAVSFAYSFSRSKRIIIEQFLVKKHAFIVGGDIFVKDGKVVLWGLLNCHRDDKVNALVPVGKSYPLDLPEEDVNRIKSELSRLVETVGLKYGLVNVEVLIDSKDRVWLVDIGPRAGGNLIPNFLNVINRTDLIKASVLASMGEQFEFEINTDEGYYATHNLHSSKSGIYEGLKFSDELESYIIEKNIYAKKGDTVEYFVNCTKALGIIFMRFPSKDVMDSVLSNINDHYTVELQ